MLMMNLNAKMSFVGDVLLCVGTGRTLFDPILFNCRARSPGRHRGY